MNSAPSTTTPTTRGIHAIAASTPRAGALFHGDTCWSYGQLDRRANGVAHALTDAGVGPGDRVAVALHNRPEVFSAWIGIARVGALVVPISYRAAPGELRYIIEDAEVGVLVHDGVADGVDLNGVVRWRPGGGALSSEVNEPPTGRFIESAVSWMSYTSGTTGRPKGIVRPAPAPATEAPPQPYAQLWGFGPGKPHLLCGPAYHTAPGAYAQMSLVEGGPVVIMAPFDAREALALIDGHDVTSSHMVPANFVRILEVPSEERDAYDLSSIERIIHAAAPCPVPIKRAIIDVFPEGTVWEYYGASEGMGTMISPEDWLAHPGSVGRAFPGLDIEVRDDDGQPVPPGTIGTVYLTPVPGYAFAYHNAPEKTDEAWQDGRFTVGDLGWLDEDGFLYLADRRTDLILRGGVNVYPAEIEEALALHPKVVDSAVLGLPDERLGQEVHAVVETNDEVGVADLVGFLREHLAAFKIPRTWQFVDTLPREPNGKIRKRELREAALAAAEARDGVTAP